jgi:hypothetical protein
MRTTTSLLAALALTACGSTAPEYALETQGIARADGDVPETTMPAPEVDADIRIVTIDGIPRIDDPDFPGASIDPENRQEEDQPREDAPEEPGEAGQSTMDRTFDPTGYCEPEPAERACPTPDPELGLTEVQERQMVALYEACEAWMERGPASYIMEVTETLITAETEDVADLEAVVCTGATVEAVDLATGAPIAPESLPSIDNLYWAAADHIVKGEQVQVTVDPNLLAITRMTVVYGTEAEREIFEVSTNLRPILPDPAE